MKHPFNYLGLLSLPALAALLYFPTGKIDFIGFLGLSLIHISEPTRPY